MICKNLARHAYGRASQHQKLMRHEPQCLIGCDAYADVQLAINRFYEKVVQVLNEAAKLFVPVEKLLQILVGSSINCTQRGI